MGDSELPDIVVPAQAGPHTTVVPAKAGSLPFDAGECRKIAVKIVDDRGIESLKIVSLD